MTVEDAAALTHLQEVEQQRRCDVGQRLHVEHLSQPAPAVVEAVRDGLQRFQHFNDAALNQV